MCFKLLCPLKNVFYREINFSLNEMFSYVEIDVAVTLLLTIHFTLGRFKNNFMFKALIYTLKHIEVMEQKKGYKVEGM